MPPMSSRAGARRWRGSVSARWRRRRCALQTVLCCFAHACALLLLAAAAVTTPSPPPCRAHAAHATGNNAPLREKISQLLFSAKNNGLGMNIVR
jgi:hypothetical protein